MEGGATGGTDAELVSKTLQFEHKLFYFDLKENPRGRYLKISEKTSATRSTIIVPVDGIVWFLELFGYYISTDEQDAFSKELKLDTKVAGADRSSIILPLSSLKQFHEMIGHFVAITKDRRDATTGADVRTLEPAQV
ncbi:hypothetical protein BHE74_00043350 [Ensete ventricosum]|uniref:Uncharacterized protein n=1 Tax=Ensete ventricosum TaxID=4639 RepID=A0A426Z479_ENSVE|nr:hypothetical protein B296_00041933 [Ensete ventricosum]RWW32671.1 hypothetical protein GW17_00002645 [Ensete ventricosum]RWW50406.1 hypothetical protein BHE74_00043350 [Ensete ventricosum]RZS07690.1 hypothetical protein BHM03_00038563 [Ensete ventricosum]